MKCEVEGCETEGKMRRGMCNLHYRRFMRNGHPTSPHDVYGSAQRYLENVVLPFEDETECLIWPHMRDAKGYAQIKVSRKGKSVNRIVCTAVHGEPPTPKHEAAHSCGKGSSGCCNPHHLRWATHKENEHDKFAHGTVGRGALNGMTKLSEEQVLEIVALRGIESQRVLASRFNVNRIAIQGIYRGKAWSWLTGITPKSTNDNEPSTTALAA